MGTEQKKIAAQNKKAFHDYFVLDRYEAGIELCGTEVKSIRAGTMNLKDSYCTVKDGELFVHSMHISPYEQGNRFNRDPMRKKRLLLHKKEIMKLFGASQQQGLSIIPLKLYIFKGRAKLEIGLCKGKKCLAPKPCRNLSVDHSEYLDILRQVRSLPKKDSDRAIERAMKGNY